MHHSECPNFLNKHDPRFAKLRNTMDTVFRDLRTEGVGAESKSTEILTKEEENKLWDSGILGVSCPISLQRAVFFVLGKYCCLRGGEEHRNLCLSQLTR